MTILVEIGVEGTFSDFCSKYDLNIVVTTALFKDDKVKVMAMFRENVEIVKDEMLIGIAGYGGTIDEAIYELKNKMQDNIISIPTYPIKGSTRVKTPVKWKPEEWE